MNEPPSLDSPTPVEKTSNAPRKPPRFLFPFIFLLIYWLLFFAVGALEKPYFYGFIYTMASTALLTLFFVVWWWFNRALALADKVIGFILILGLAWSVGRNSHHSINFFTLWLTGFPVLVTLAVGWIYLARSFRLPSTRAGLVAIVTLTWGYFLLIRNDGTDSMLKSEIHWRWTSSAEERFLAQTHNSGNVIKPAPTTAPNLSPFGSPLTDSVAFRGTNRDGLVLGTSISTNWGSIPPTLVWKHSVGPAWSSVLVVGNRLFTQEQRGDKEAVVCYEAATGQPVWTHEDTVRFEEPLSGAGPRATPTYASGRLYTQGATGLLNCLDAETGAKYWGRDIKTESGAPEPMWGFSSSPLVAEGIVIVYAGGPNGKGLLAYRAASGEPVWNVPAGDSSYSSPQVTRIQGVDQCLILHDGGLTSVEIVTGKKLWETGLAMKGAPRCTQPRMIGETNLLVAGLNGTGTSLLEVSKSGDKWNVTERWQSKNLKPEFPDFIVCNGYAYGTDTGIFCCIKLSDGSRSWKEGRYGRGQVVLLADQQLLIVTSESGEAVLLAADSTAQKEIGRFQAIQGKTWNSPVIEQNRLYLRNAQEMACYSLAGRR